MMKILATILGMILIFSLLSSVIKAQEEILTKAQLIECENLFEQYQKSGEKNFLYVHSASYLSRHCVELYKDEIWSYTEGDKYEKWSERLIELNQKIPTNDTVYSEATVETFDIIKKEIEGQYLYFFQLCAGSERITAPEVVISSDIESHQIITLGSSLGSDSCHVFETSVLANDPNSIKAEFVNSERDEKLVNELLEEIVDLKEQIAKKDAVLMEQLKVIMDLANKLINTVYEKFVSLLSF